MSNFNRTGFAPQPWDGGSGPDGQPMASDVGNDSIVPGDNVKEALDELYEGPAPSTPVVINDGETKTILSHDGSEYRTIEYIVSVNDNNTGDYFSATLLAQHDDIEATHSQYAMIGKKTVKLFAEYVGGLIELRGTGLKDNQIVRAISLEVTV